MIKNEILLNSGQHNLAGWYWQAENPEAIVILIHGFGEHISRYDHVAEKFTAKDISVLGVDLIGHGNFTGIRGHVDSIKDFLLNAYNFLRVKHDNFVKVPAKMSTIRLISLEL